MSGLLDRDIERIGDRLALLAPAGRDMPASFACVCTDSGEHQRILQELQRVRGAIYVRDGAVRPEQLTGDGRHVTPQDARSWHILMLNGQRRVSGCIWYLEHESQVSPKDLRLHGSPLATDRRWKTKLRRAVRSEIGRARAEHLPYAEVGGWAVSDESESPLDGFLLALAAYSLSRSLGGALGVTTATVRHSSSRILRRLGLSGFEVDGEAIPPYYDPHYACTMELLRFDSRWSNPRYHMAIERLKDRLSGVAVVSAAGIASAAPTYFRVSEPLFAA